MSESDQFNGRLGLIFASIGAAIGTGNIWRFPRMVGANGGGTFLIPWLIFLISTCCLNRKYGSTASRSPLGPVRPAWGCASPTPCT